MTGAEAQIQNLQLALQAKDQALTDFTYTVSHDLKANLRHIKAYLGILQEDMAGALQPEWQGYMDVVLSAASKMGQQIDALTALSQIDRQAVNAHELPMTELIEEARKHLQSVQAGRDVQWHVAQDFPALMGDSSMVRQIWQHLLHNALKFTRAQSMAQITVGWQREADAVWCFVQDNGEGFQTSQSQQLFKVFQKLHAGDEGLGLGLALVRKLVERQGGQVKAHAEPGRGAWIGFSLPAGV